MPVSPARSLAQRAAWLRAAREFPRRAQSAVSSGVAALRSVLSAFDRTAFQNAADPLLPTEAALGGDDESSVFGLLERHGAADAADFLRTAVAEAAAARREVDEDGSVQILSTSDGLYSVVWRSVARRDDNRTAFTVSGTRLEWLRSVFRGEPAAFEPSLFAMLARYDAVSEAGAGAQAAVPAGVYRAFHQAWPREAEVGEAVVEGFASPLNHQLVAARRVDFGTAFADTDAPFGGVGPFETHADALCSEVAAHALAAQPSVWAARDARDVASPRAHARSRRRRRLRTRGRARRWRRAVARRRTSPRWRRRRTWWANRCASVPASTRTLTGARIG